MQLHAVSQRIPKPNKRSINMCCYDSVFKSALKFVTVSIPKLSCPTCSTLLHVSELNMELAVAAVKTFLSVCNTALWLAAIYLLYVGLIDII